LLVELIHDIPLIVDADRDHLKPAIFELVVENLHLRHFLNAGLAPGRPEIEEDDFSTVVGELN